MADSIITPGVTYEYGNSVRGDCVSVHLVNIMRPGATDGPATDSAGLDNLIAQNVTGSIQKQPRQFYEVGTNKFYFVESRPSGSGSIEHIIGPNGKDIWATMQGFASVCHETKLYMGKKPDCSLCKTQGVVTTGEICFNSGLLNSFQVTATANDWVLTSRLGFTFYDLTNETYTTN